MPPKANGWLWDIVKWGRYIVDRTNGMTVESYETDLDARLAIERAFEIVGEAARRMADADPNQAARLDGLRKIIGFRNVLAHQYDRIDNTLVWAAIVDFLPEFVRQAESLLNEQGYTFP